MNPYWAALREIPRGETRSFTELAAMAGRPGAARAAGRATACCPVSPTHPVHRVVNSQGRARDAVQLGRLRREGARPLARESLAAWAKRTSRRLVGYYPSRQFVPRNDRKALTWNPEMVEAFTDEASASARGFRSGDGAAPSDEPLPTRREVTHEASVDSLIERCGHVDWNRVRGALAREGGYHLQHLLTPSECASILNASTQMTRFERSVDMQPRGYGVGSYHYYKEPLPSTAQTLRDLLYRRLAPSGYPSTLTEFWRRCREAGQRRPSSILIGYGKGGINHPHRDVYGPVFFPYQALVALSKRGRDFTGGDFYLVDEADPGARRPFKVTEGDVVIFATRDRRPARRKLAIRHGMTTVTRGRRYGLGLVFHLAE